MALLDHQHWIFDMDGTLTVAVHDFEAIRRALGLPPGAPILEAIAAQPPGRAAELYAELDVLELEFARQATAQPGIVELLDVLARRGVDLGIVTRNSEALALETLARAGLVGFFGKADIVGRESAPPKPAPDGIERLLRAWGGTPAAGVMVGDFVYDLEAGSRAGVSTVYYDANGEDRWSGQADHRVCDHAELLMLALTAPLDWADRPLPAS